MSDPAEGAAAPTEVAPPPGDSAPPGRTRRPGAALLLAAAGIAVVIAGIAASPFWAPAVMPLLPWGLPGPKAQPVPQPTPSAPDPTLAAAKAQAAQNAAAIQQLGQRLAALEAKPTPDLGPIQQQLTALTKSTDDLTASVAALQKAAQAQPAGDPSLTGLALTVLQIREALDIARPFAAEYQTLVALSRNHPEIATAAAPLADAATSGVASRATLAERLRQLAPQIAAARPAPASDWRSQIVARLESLVTIRRIDGAAQSPAETAVGAAQRALASGDLSGAIDALAGLSGANLTAAAPWLTTARQRLAVETALRQVEAALAAALGDAVPPGKS